MLLPTAMMIPVCYDRTGSAVWRGGFADMWKGEHCGQDVAVKVLRMYSMSNIQRIVGVGPQLSHLSTSQRADRSCLEVLQGGHDVEIPSASKCSTADRSDDD